MSTKQTDGGQENKLDPNNWIPDSGRVRRKASEPIQEDVEAEYQKMVEDGVLDGVRPKRNLNDENEDTIGGNDTIQPIANSGAGDSLQTELAKSDERSVQPVIKRTSQKQRKDSLEEYRQTFLTIPKLDDRKPVFVSREVRDRIDEIVHRLGGRGRSVSGFIENLARHHLEIYQDEVELWKKL